MARLLQLIITTLLGLLILLPTIPALAIPIAHPVPIPAPAPAPSTDPGRAGAVWTKHWFQGTIQPLELGCNFLLRTKGLAGHVSSYVVLPGFKCWFYEDQHCFGGELFVAEGRDDATLDGHHDDKIASVACNYAD